MAGSDGLRTAFGGIARTAQSIAHALRQFNIPAGTAVAPTVGSAWAFARLANCSLTLIAAAELPQAILTLPVLILRLHDGVLFKLNQVGLKTVGELLSLPRAELPARFGTVLCERLDQLTGAIAEPLKKLVYDPPVTVGARFEAPIESPEISHLFFSSFSKDLLIDLARRPWRTVYERYRQAARYATLLQATGIVQREGQVIHVVPKYMHDRSTLLENVRQPSRDFH